MNTEAEFHAYMKAASNTSGDLDNNHLSEVQMLAYCRGEVSAAEREATQAHLVSCEQCIALFRGARDFLEPPRPEEDDVTTAQTNEAWHTLRQRLQIVSTPQTNSGTTSVEAEAADFPSRDRKIRSVSRVTLALAACLLISFGALGWLAFRFWQERRAHRSSQQVVAQLTDRQRELERQLAQNQQSGGEQLKQEHDQRVAAEAKRDQLQSQLAAAQQGWQNIPVYTARLSSDRGQQDELRLNFNNRVAATLVRFLIAKPYEFPEYEVILLDQHEAIVREISGLRPTGDDGALSFRLDRATFSTGKYKLRLFGQRGNSKKQLGDYELSVSVL